METPPNILGYTVRELERLSDVQVAEAEGDFAGACWSVDLAHGWTEIAALYVLPQLRLPQFRGSGFGETLFRAAWDRSQRRERHVYVLSRNPQVVGWMREMGMTVDGKLWRAAGRALIHAAIHGELAPGRRERAQAQADRAVSAAGAGGQEVRPGEDPLSACGCRNIARAYSTTPTSRQTSSRITPPCAAASTPLIKR